MYILTNFITNFKPKILNFNSTYKFKSKQTIVCKNFLIYLLLLKYKNNSFFNNSNIFIKKQKKNVYTILRAPYRHKLSRHQLTFSRYKILSSIKIKHSKIELKNFLFLIKIIVFLKKSNKFFESNLIYLNNIEINFKFKYNNNFLINNFILKKNIIKFDLC